MALDAETLARVREGIREIEPRLREFEKDIEQAHRAGLDVTDLRARLKVNKEQLFKLKQVYGQ